jgi:hypothetical protein
VDATVADVVANLQASEGKFGGGSNNGGNGRPRGLVATTTAVAPEHRDLMTRLSLQVVYL